MLESNKPELDLDLIMAEIRREIEERRARSGGVRATPSQPEPASPEIIQSFWNPIGNYLETAGSQAQAATFAPTMSHRSVPMRWFARATARLILHLSKFMRIPQAHFNNSVVQALQNVDHGGSVLSQAVNTLQSQAMRQGKELAELTKSVETILERTAKIKEGQEQIGFSLHHFKEDLAAVTRTTEDVVSDLKERLETQQKTQTRLSHQQKRLRTNVSAKIGSLEQALRDENHATEKTLSRLRAITTRNQTVLTKKQKDLADLFESTKAELSSKLTSTDEQMDKLEKELNTQTRKQEAGFDQLGILESTTHKVREEQEKRLAARAARQQSRKRLAEIYVDFETRFRGSRELIRTRQQIYLDLLLKGGLGSEDKPIVDLGCGRGEWLELLQEARLSATGVDSHPGMISVCKEFGLKVVKKEGLTYLKEIPSSSVGAVTVFHVVEHLRFEVLLEWMYEIYRVLVKRGLVILETPDPANLTVGSCDFYLDPTHNRPIPSALLEFVLQRCGFKETAHSRLHPVPDAPQDSRLGPIEREFFFGPRDYSIIAKKA